ncbi:MAG: sortase [Anaerolineae bacterium]|nr:sortase [Anaerolineae bacterium]MDW8101505.1 sortase [Anaerolineae bacterium]
MGDKRTVDELSIEELERILLLKKMEARARQRERLALEGRLVLRSEQNAGAATSLQPRPKALKRWQENLLLSLEIIALIGLLAVVIISFINIHSLNQEVAQALGAPPPTPTPIIDVVILPGRPPQPSGDLPARYRDMVKPAPPVVIPTPSPGAPTRIVIPKIGVDAPVVEGDGWEELKRGVGHHIGSANPGERGNMVLSGHNDIFGEVFRDLHKLDLGDEIIVYAGEVPYRYIVKAKKIVEPTDVSVMAPTTTPIVTLITCYPYRIDTHRLIIVGELSQ